MDRSAWLREKRRLTEERMDTLFAPIYDDDWGASIAPTHQRFFARFLGLLPPGAHILDAACGTGKYWPLILASGRTVLGIDQSQEMLKRARAKHLEVTTKKMGLQEMSYQAAFAGACCMDAMEFIFPEDWLLVLSNLHRALLPGGPLYFTVEIADEQDIAQAFAAGQEMGLPVVYGEWAHEGGYHYYPRIEQVRAWIDQANFELIDEAEDDEYHHFLVHKG